MLNWINKPLRIIFLCSALFLISTATLSATEGASPAVDDAVVEPAQADQAPLCRLGVNAPAGIAQFPFAPLRLGWYINYGASTSPNRPNGVEYMPMIRVHQNQDATGYIYSPSGATLDAAIQANPGASWFIGNEPDRRDWNGGAQDEILPQLYAQVYHELYHYIKGRDPAAKILAGSIVQPTPLRLKYLDIVLDTYQALYGEAMPVDGWSIHNFILNEASCAHFPSWECWGAEIPPGLSDQEGLRVDVQDNDNFDLFVEQIERFRRWMSSRGYRDVPLYLSEYGVLMPAGHGFNPDFTPARVNAFMNKTFDYLLNTVDPIHGNPADGYRLVQRLSWFSMSYSNFNGRLFDADTLQPTPMGNNFAAYAATLAKEADFYPVQLYTGIPQISTGGLYIATLKATIANSGNTLASYDVRVRFYNGDPKAGGQQIGSDQIVSLAGCGDTEIAQVVWTGVPKGTYPIYVRVDAVDGSAPETEEAKANNTRSGLLIVGGETLFLPRINR